MIKEILNIFSDIEFSGKSVTNVSFNDVVDILIISFLIYKVMIWIKETKAWSLLKGFLVILAINISANIFDLYTVKWIIENTFSIGLIALVVILQPELRNALEQLGKGKFLSEFIFQKGDNQKITRTTRDELLRAIDVLSSQRTGALIAYEQQNSLVSYEKTGILINGAISSQLLINIFEDKTPLHDGAVILRDNRIVAATCILPLTTSEHVDKSLGTRHRAAIGLSEMLDALLIVVSEETGDVSIARGGKLFRSLTPNELKAILTIDEAAPKKPIISWRGRRKDEK